MNDPSPTPKRHPLGLPAGSVRALLALLVVGFLVVQTALGRPVRLLWTETLMIVLAHYFTSRRFVELAPDLRERLERDGAIEADTQPLYLPKHTVRVLVVLAFGGLAVYLARQGRLFEPQAVAILGTVGAYFLGILFRLLLAWWTRHSNRPVPRWWTDGKALVTLLVVGGTIVIQVLDFGRLLPVDPRHLEAATLGLVLFYFGSR